MNTGLSHTVGEPFGKRMRQSDPEPAPGFPADVPRTLVVLARSALGGDERDALLERDPAGAWSALTNREILRRADAVAAALRARGVGAGDRIALMSPNRSDWIVAHLGILFAGGVSVPIYATQPLDQVAYILNDAAARLLFVDTPTAAERLAAAAIGIETIVFDGSGAATLAALVERGAATRDAARTEPAPDDLAVLIYTSGTTGTPKGVMLTQANLASNVVDAFSLLIGIVLPGDPVLAVLPLAHIYEHTNVFGHFWRGATIYLNHRIDELLGDLRDVRPVAMFGVPRIFERMHAAILDRARSGGAVRARLVPWAVGVGRRYRRALAEGKTPGLARRLAFRLAYALVLKQIRPLLGCDRLRFFGSGSAALQTDIAFAFAGAGITIVEGYGLTECSPVVTANDVRAPRIGTVGRPIPNVEVRIAADGELEVRGPNVMRGYYHQPDESAAVLHDGWLGTGDVATIDADGFVRIVDRKKEIFKTSGGKYVAPSRVEAAILRSPLVAQAVVVGNARPHPAALIAPNWTALRNGLRLPADASSVELAARSDVRAVLIGECVRATAELGPFEQIRWIGVLPHELTIDGGELTPTLKVRRRIVEERYTGLIPEYR
jgi:long-chain acyl-CoA synthetase